MIQMSLFDWTEYFDPESYELLSEYFNCKERGFSICVSCLGISQTRDIARHYCHARNNVYSFINRGLTNLRTSVIFTICLLKPILGRDVAVYIAKFLYSFKSGLSLYNPHKDFSTLNVKKKGRRKKKKERKEKYSQTKDIVDTYELYHNLLLYE